MRQVSFTSALVVGFLLLSLGFVAYLYPLPDQNVAKVLSTMTPTERLEVEAFLHSSYWASWFTHGILLILGVCSASLWLLHRGRQWRGWTAVLAAALFGLLCAIALLIQVGDDGVVDAKSQLLKRLWSAHAWMYLAAEVHRILAMTIALVAAVAMANSLKKSRGR